MSGSSERAAPTRRSIAIPPGPSEEDPGAAQPEPGQDPPPGEEGTAKVASPYMNLRSSYVVIRATLILLVTAAQLNEEG